ncbi:MAG: response regulator transcription factor [Pyrinomonadaceae bacterium]
MDAHFRSFSRRKTSVTVLATHSLTRQSLQALLDCDRELNVLDAVGTTSELIEKITRHIPDVVLLCLLESEGSNIDVLSEIREINPQIKTVILTSPKSYLDQAKALKLGVTGIVGTDKSSRVLIRAIRQVSEGDVWLNQKLLAQLVSGTFNAPSETATNKWGYYSDDLTVRELEIVGMIGLGMNNKNISGTLRISEATVRHHLSSIYGKLDVEDRLNLAIYAHQHQMLQPAMA